MRTKIKLLALALLTAPAIVVAEDDPKEVLRRAVDPPTVVYAGDMTVTYWRPNRTSAEEVHVEYNPPSRYRWQFLSPDGNVDRVMVSDGETEQLHIITGRRTVSGDAPKTVAKGMSREREWDLLLANYDVALLTDEDVAGRTCRVIELKPRVTGKPVQRLWLDRSSGVILEIRRSRPQSGAAMVSRFVRFRSWPPADPNAPVIPVSGRPTDRPAARGRAMEPDYLSREDLAKDGRFRLPLPDDLRDGFIFESADFLDMGGQTIHQVRYTDGLCVLSLFQTEKATRQSDKKEPSSHTGLLEVVSWKQEGSHYTLVGDVSRDLLNEISREFRPEETR